MRQFGNLIPAILLISLVLQFGCTGDPTEAQLNPPPRWTSFVKLVNEASHNFSVSPESAQRRLDSWVQGAQLPASAVTPLAYAIRFSQSQALAAKQQPIPADVRRALEPYFDRRLLDQVTWVLPGRRVSLGSFLAGWYYREAAVTLDHVVVFSDRELAHNVFFWAHELTHVQQYERLGTDGFAAAYVADWRAVEADAEGNAVRITDDIKRQRGLGQTQAHAAVEGARNAPAINRR